jgi:hypothetical protein
MDGGGLGGLQLNSPFQVDLSFSPRVTRRVDFQVGRGRRM